MTTIDTHAILYNSALRPMCILMTYSIIGIFLFLFFFSFILSLHNIRGSKLNLGSIKVWLTFVLLFSFNPGYYCPAKTKYATEYPCPRGTFNNQTHRVSVDDCMPCSGGSYCETEGLSEPTGLCNPGKITMEPLLLKLILLFMVFTLTFSNPPPWREDLHGILSSEPC